jgi:Cft2 family RNA processing exonuclease
MWKFVEMEVGKTVLVDDPANTFTVTAYGANHCPGNSLVSNCSSSAHVIAVWFVSVAV